MEEVVRANLKRYRSFVEVSGELGWITNADGEVVEDIPSWRKFTGQTYEEVKGWGWSKAIHPDDLEHTERVWREAIKTKNAYEVEYRLRRRDGIYCLFEVHGVPVFREDGSVLEWVGTNIDITERKKNEEALRKSEEEYSSLFANMIDGFAYCQMIFDEKGKPVDFVYLQINDAFRKNNRSKKRLGHWKESITGNTRNKRS